MLALEDLKWKTEEEVKKILAYSYGSVTSYDGGIVDEAIANKLKELDILIAYESVGSWGCDSSSFFLFREKETGKLFEMHGSHCSCYGFEGQFGLEETTLESLEHRAKEGGGVFSAGGYDGDSTWNQEEARKLIMEMIK